jgi:hypothetical protein
MTEGHIRMMGPEVNGGFVFEPLGGEYGKEGVYLFSLGSRTSAEPVFTEIEVPPEAKGREPTLECLIRWE